MICTMATESRPSKRAAVHQRDAHSKQMTSILDKGSKGVYDTSEFACFRSHFVNRTSLWILSLTSLVAVRLIRDLDDSQDEREEAYLDEKINAELDVICNCEF